MHRQTVDLERLDRLHAESDDALYPAITTTTVTTATFNSDNNGAFVYSRILREAGARVITIQYEEALSNAEKYPQDMPTSLSLIKKKN